MPSWVNIETPQVGKPTFLQKFALKVINNLLFLYNSLLSVVGSRETIINGSFESDTDLNGIPDGWNHTPYQGGTFSHEQSTLAGDGKAIHGRRSVKFTSPGGASNGGGFLTSTDFFEVSEGRAYFMTWQHKSTVAGIHNLVQITFYDSTQASVSTTTLYDSTANPTGWTIAHSSFTPPANARFAKITLTGAKNDNTTAGSAWFDDVRIHIGPTPTYSVHNTGGSWVVPAGVYRVRVRCWGGGGGGVNNNNGGGGGGGYGEDIFTVVPGVSHAVTIGGGGAAGAAGGAGSTSSLGSLISATGGAGGVGGAGGAGGTSSATINVTGATGGGTGSSCGGSTGGGGGLGGIANGAAGTAPGGGGAGNSGGVAGAGQGGRIIIEYLV